MRAIESTGYALVALMVLGATPTSQARSLPSGTPTLEQLAADNELFLSLARKALRWEEPQRPFRIAGPLYFVGTKGLGAFLFATPEGHVLMNTGMPSSGPMIVDSIRQLGFDPADIRYMINGHAHIDHAGAFAYLKDRCRAELLVMAEDVAAMESGDAQDFYYGADFRYPPVRVDRVLRDGDRIEIGDVVLTAHLTPGHTRGSTSWIANIVDDGRAYVVAFPDGAGFNPGYRLTENPSYPGIADDFRRTHHELEMVKPDIWLAQHNEYYDMEGKLARSRKEGVKAWVDPEGYRRFVAGKKRAFEAQIDLERGAVRPEAAAPETRVERGSVPVTVHDFERAETDRYLAEHVRKHGLGKFAHTRGFTPVDEQDVVRMNRDTLYSSGAFDLDAGPVTIVLPDPGRRYMSLLALDQDHYVVDVAYGPVWRTYDRARAGTRYLFVILRTFADPTNPEDLRQANALQDEVRADQSSAGSFDVPDWDQVSLKEIRDALAALGRLGGVVDRFGDRSEVDPIDHLIGTATGWGGNPAEAAEYVDVYPTRNDGKSAYELTLRDVPVDAFWSITVYDADGFMAPNDEGMYSVNDRSARPNPDGSFTIRFGGDPRAANRLPITPGWNYTVRLYRPRAEILDGSWRFPEARPVE